MKYVKDKLKTAKQMERHLKGLANHYRIEILLLISDRGVVTFDQIVEKIEANPKTLHVHTMKLYNSGLINKDHKGRFVEHKLSPYGREVVNFLKSFQKVKAFSSIF